MRYFTITYGGDCVDITEIVIIVDKQENNNISFIVIPRSGIEFLFQIENSNLTAVISLPEIERRHMELNQVNAVDGIVLCCHS